jgi:hypothetical protein
MKQRNITILTALAMITCIVQRGNGADTIVHTLDPDQDSLQQMRTILEAGDPVSAVHVYSHAGQFTFY